MYLKGNLTYIPEKISRLEFPEFVAGIFLIFLLFVRFVYIFSYNTDLEGVEFALVHFVQMIVLKGHLYGNAAKFPYLLVVHAPLYYYLMAGLMKMCAVDVVNQVHLMYVIGRTISFLLLLANYYMLLKIINILAPGFKHKIYTLVIFTLFLPGHFYACRPDSIKLTFFVLFFYNTLRFYKTNKWSYHFCALLFLTVSIFCKQDVLVYGCLLYAVFYFSERRLVYLLSPFFLLLIISICLYLFYLLTKINLVKELFFYNLQYDSDISINLKLIAAHSFRILPLFLLSLWNLKSKERLTISLFALSVLYYLTSCLFMLRIGSNFNYTYESILLLLLNIILVCNEENIRANPILVSIYIFSIFTFNQMIYYKAYFFSATELNYKRVFVHNEASSRKIKQLIGNDILFIPDMKYYIFYADSRLIYGSDWHYDRYCEIALNIRIKPQFIHNDITTVYDKQFTNGVVQYILTEDNVKSKNHIAKYYPYFTAYKQVDNFILYKFKSAL